MRKKVATEDDTTSVWTSKVEYLYCIQPLVVNKMDDNRYVVIDRQQRITTIAIMLAVLSFLEREIEVDKNSEDERKSRIFINYQSRPRSEELINSLYEIKILDELRQNYSENIDFDYIIWAFETTLKYYKVLHRCSY